MIGRVFGCLSTALRGRNRVETVTTPGMATADTFCGKPGPVDWAIALYGFHAIGGTTRKIAAIVAKQGRGQHLINTDQALEHGSHAGPRRKSKSVNLFFHRISRSIRVAIQFFKRRFQVRNQALKWPG